MKSSITSHQAFKVLSKYSGVQMFTVGDLEFVLQSLQKYNKLVSPSTFKSSYKQKSSNKQSPNNKKRSLTLSPSKTSPSKSSPSKSPVTSPSRFPLRSPAAPHSNSLEFCLPLPPSLQRTTTNQSPSLQSTPINSSARKKRRTSYGRNMQPRFDNTKSPSPEFSTDTKSKYSDRRREGYL